MRVWRTRSWLAIVCGLTAVSCGQGSAPQAIESAPPVTASAPTAATTARPKVVVLGDSLTAGLGLQPSQAYPALLQQKLTDAGYSWDVVNAGVSGDTTAAGLDRLDWALQEPNVKILVLELGANDGLRGLPPAEMEKNLAAIIQRAQARGIGVLLTGMEAPPNYGPDYTAAFHRVYPDLARKYHVPLVPFLLDKVAGIPSLNQADGIHPTAAGAQIVANTVWRGLKPLVDAAPAS